MYLLLCSSLFFALHFVCRGHGRRQWDSRERDKLPTTPKKSRCPRFWRVFLEVLSLNFHYIQDEKSMKICDNRQHFSKNRWRFLTIFELTTFLSILIMENYSNLLAFFIEKYPHFCRFVSKISSIFEKNWPAALNLKNWNPTYTVRTWSKQLGFLCIM